jgi:hypothetical protein
MCSHTHARPDAHWKDPFPQTDLQSPEVSWSTLGLPMNVHTPEKPSSHPERRPCIARR